MSKSSQEPAKTLRWVPDPIVKNFTSRPGYRLSDICRSLGQSNTVAFKWFLDNKFLKTLWVSGSTLIC